MATLITPRSESVAKHLSPFGFVYNLWSHRDLVRQFTRREIEGRYKGSFLGLFWSVVNPLSLLLIYTFVFGVVFKARWPQAQTDNLSEFALVLFCSLTAFQIFSECVSRAAGIIVGVPNYVKKVVFPLEILPVSVMGSALFHCMISLSILMIANWLIRGNVQWTLVLVPLVALPLIFLSLGMAWFISSLGVFIRDINYVVTLMVQILFYATPIFYPIEAIPEPLQTIIRFNPLASCVENFRRVILWGQAPDWRALGGWLVATGIVMLLGYAWFMRTKKAFADVI
jgi:lipopolysaccharide transport system permease protein